MKIMFTDLDKQTFIVFNDDGTHSLISNPPGSDEDQKIIDDYGGLYEVERTWVDYHRDLHSEEEVYEKFLKYKESYIENMTIESIVNETLSKSDVMTIKMSIFKKEEVRECKDRDLLTDLRKADNIVDIVMYFGLIRKAHVDTV